MENAQKNSTSASIVKWLIIGVLGTFFLTVLSIGVVLWRFTPIVKINPENGRVLLLGGLIDVTEDFTIHASSKTIKIGTEEHRKFEGSKKIEISKNAIIKIPFSNGKLDISNAENELVSWDCKISGSTENPKVKTVDHLTTLDLSTTNGVKCDITVPKNIKLEIAGSNGKLHFEKPHYNLDVNLANGKVDLEPDDTQLYRYDIKVVNGVVDKFESSIDATAFIIKVSLVNGVISRD